MRQETIRAMYSKSILYAAVLIGVACLQLGCASKSPQVKDVQWQTGELCKGMKQFAHGYKELNKADTEFDNKNPEEALIHLGKARVHFNNATEFFTKARMTAEEAKIYDQICEELVKGNKELDKASEASNQSKEGRAGEHLERAMVHFANAMELIP